MHNRRQRRRICMRSIAVFLIAAMLCTGLPAMPVMATETQSISSEDTVPSGEEDPLEDMDPSEETDPPEETDPSKEENPSEETDPSKEESPSGETEPSEEENHSGETEPSEEENPSGEAELSEEEMPEETVSGNDIIQSDITASGDEEDDSMYRPEYLPLIEPIELPESGVSGSPQTYINDQASLESTYDSRKEGILTPVRNQNPWGTCWAFAAIGSMESSLLKQGLGTFDLSERHLAYFAYHTRNDALGIANDDTITTVGSPSYLNNGGNIMTSVSALMNWQGAAAESKYPYVNNSTGPADLARAVSQDAAVILKDCYMINTKANDAATIQNIKTLVKQYGGVVWSYYDAGQFYNASTHAYYNNVTKNEGNHAIMVVGWDDNYSKNNFNNSPKNNGAWIVRNSWSSNWGENGYFYISYEDTSLGSSGPAAVFIAGLSKEYDHNYFNSNTMTGHNWAGKGNENLVTKMAQIYTIQGNKTGMEQLCAVSFLTGSPNTEYSIQIYRNPQKNEDGLVKDPESGKPMLSKPVTGRTTYQGLYTIDLKQPAIAAKGDVIAIVITFPKGGYIGVDDNIYNFSSAYRYNNQVKMGESLVGNHLGFFDLAENDHTSLRINALTKDVESMFAVAVDDVRLTDFEGNGVVRLIWDPCPDAETYEIWRSDSRDGEFKKIAEQSADQVESYEESIRAENTYYYKVRAVLADGSTRDSEAVEVKADTIVFSCDIRGQMDNMKAVLSWDPVAGATGYELSKKAPGQPDYITLGEVTDGESYTDDLSDEDVGDYEYRLRAFNAEGSYTEWSSPKVVPFEFKLEQTAYNKVKFTWTEYYNSPGYHLLVNKHIIRSIPANLTEKEENMTERFSYNWLGEFKAGEDYTYGLFAGYGGSFMTPPIYQYPSVTFRTVPEVSFTSVTKAEDGITLQWENGAAQQMEIYRNTMPKIPDVPYKTVDADENSYTDTEIEGGTGYYYWLRPILTNSSGELVEGEMTDSKYIANSLLDKATVLKSVKAGSATDAVITWESNLSSSGYSLYRSTELYNKGEKITEITDNTVTEYTDTELSPGTAYYYSIAAHVSSDSGTKEDVLSPQAGVRMLPSVPVLEMPTWSGGRVIVEWGKTEGADGYVLERLADGDLAVKQIAEIDSADIVQYEDSDTVYDMRYVYRVKAYNTDINGKRQYAAKASNTKVFATPITPVAIKEIRAINEHSLQIIWDDVENATRYALYRYAEGVYMPIAENIYKADDADDMISYTDAQRVTGKTYYYKVMVYKNGTHSELEMTGAASGYTRPAIPTVVRATHDTITIQNNPSYEYAISKTYQAASALSYTYSTDTNSTETELTFEGLEPDSTYYIYVRTKQSVTDEDPVYGPVLQTTTKIKTELVLSSTDVVVSKGNRVDITTSLKPSNLHYTGLVWSAYKEDGTAYDTQKVGSIFKVIGSDDKEILRLTGNTLSATGESTDKEVYLQAEVDELTAQCHVVVNVPVTGITMSGFKVNGEARDSLDNIRVSDVIEVSVFPAPAYNADDAACYWSTSNENVLKIIDSTGTTVTLQAEGIGNCVLKASTADGISTEKKITVQKKEEVYGIWLTDKELSDTELSNVKVTSDENGSFETEGLETKPAYELVLGKDTAGKTDRVTVYAYALTAGNSEKDEDGKVTGGSLARTSSCSYKSANPLIAEVSSDGVIKAKSPGSTDIFAYDTTGNAVYGSCHIEVTGDKPQEEAKTWPFDKAYKFSAVTSSVSIHSYDVDEKSSAKLRIKDQYGNEYTPQDNAKWFTFTSADPSVCIVDETGEVTPNPEYIPKKNKTVTVTAALKNDLGKRKVTFKVTILAVKQVSSVEILSVSQTGDMQTQDAEVQYVPAPDTVRARYEKNGTMTFSAMAYDRFGEEMTTALQWSVTDTSIATVKLNADKKSVTVTFKKAGRTNLTCQAKDTWKKSASIELVLLDTAVIPSEKQVTVNLCQEMTADNRRLSGDFQLRIPAGADVGTLQIQEIKKGKTALTPQEAVRFSIVDKQNACYSIAIDNTNGYADSIKNNTTYELTVGTTVTGLEEIGDRQETFTVKVKVISKKPSISVASPTIDRIYTQDKNLQALLVIKAPDVVENVRVIGGSEGQINQFDDYISVKKEGGQWYAVLDASKAYQKTSIKGKLALRVSGYEEVICNVTIKTPKKAKAVKQQTIPPIYINTENSDDGKNNTADITLYNSTDKTILTQMQVVSCASAKLDVTVGDDGTLKAAVKQNVSYKNGETLTAKIQVMETDNAGNPVWADTVKVDIKVKVYTKPPKATLAQKTLTLNKKAPTEQAATTLKIDLQNASFVPFDDGDVFDITNNCYVNEDGWQSITFDEKSGALKFGFKPDRAEEVKTGSYKFRIFNCIEGYDNFYNDITVKVIDVQPTATVKVSGKLDLVNRENITLTGKLTVKNAISQIKDVAILQAKDTPEDTPKEHPYFKAVYKGNNTFSVTLTEEGKKAKLETTTYTLPVIITLEGGGRIETKMSFKPTQSVPKIKAPAAQTVYKYTGQLTKDYNLSQSLPSGVRIAKIQVVKVPEGMGVVTKNGHVLVTLSDTGMKKGSYQVSVNVYFEGEQELIGYPDGKPLSVKITVKVEN